MAGLGARLSAVERLVPPCRVAADIGSDHGRLACRLIESGKARRVIAVENRRGPYERTIRGVRECLGEGAPVAVRLGDGLDPLAPGEADVVVLAGLGGSTIAGILGRGRDKCFPGTTAVVQPMNASHLVRRWWRNAGWRIVDEVLVEERGLLYEVAAAVLPPDGDPAPVRALPFPPAVVDRYGPVLLMRRDPHLWKRLREDEEKWTGILRRVTDGGGPAARRQEAERILKEVEVVRNWLSQSEI
ncbi:MAG: class I SAM-dependent methyltransferase [Alicyclobacillaceae bacterium]|nr:class I SAM-dependent methyltransferase [Alicyclobacillaceae bacterium]